MTNPSRTLILHAGGGKTGSSAIQSFLEFHHDELLGRGVSYAMRPGLHDPFQIASGNGLPLYEALHEPGAPASLLRGLMDQYFGQAPRALVSSEWFSVMSHEAWALLADFCRREGLELRVILYLRDPIAFFQSSYVQLIKRHGEFRDFDAWFAATDFAWQHLDAARTLGSLLAPSQLRVRHYESVSGKLLADFLECAEIDATGMSLEQEQQRQVNRSLTREERELMRAINQACGAQASTAASDLLIACAPQVPADPVDIGESTLDAMRRRFGPGVDWLNSTFFGGKQVVTLAPPASAPARQAPVGYRLGGHTLSAPRLLLGWLLEHWPAASKPADTGSPTTLRALYQEHRSKVSDKWSIYLPVYESVFAPYRDRQLRLLEIGIQNGGSLEIWGRFFPRAQALIGCDINPACGALRYDNPVVSVIVGDANDDATQQRIQAVTQGLDIVIDDGSHTSSDIVRSFCRYFPMIEPGGLFVAEDLHCSYWPGFQGGLHEPLSSLAFFKSLVDIVNHEHWTPVASRASLLQGFFGAYGCELGDAQLEQIHSVEFINSMCVIRKCHASENVLGSRIIAGSVAQVVPEVLHLGERRSAPPEPAQAPTGASAPWLPGARWAPAEQQWARETLDGLAAATDGLPAIAIAVAGGPRIEQTLASLRQQWLAARFVEVDRRDEAQNLLPALVDALTAQHADWVGLVDAGDSLTPDAVFRITQALVAHPSWQLL